MANPEIKDAATTFAKELKISCKCFLEITGTISHSKITPQFLDRMELEKEKGITIKLKPVRMDYQFGGQKYVLNLVDTPGHVDFTYEVSRALAAVEGAVLLVDATQGIQAQTLANLALAKKQGLVIIPAINKIDLAQAQVEESVKELAELLEIDESEIFKISAKTGLNVEQILEAIIKRVPSPAAKPIGKSLRALIFDSDYDSFKGVLAYVRIVDGEISQNSKIMLMATNEQALAKEVGFFNPRLSPQQKLVAGEIGYIATGIKEPGRVRVGDTIVEIQSPNSKFQSYELTPLSGYLEPKPMVFASFYPEDPDDFDILKDGLAKLKLSDPALIFEPETKEALGRGFRCGFLGTLHIEIVSERLLREFGLKLVISTPSVAYKILNNSGKEEFIYSASDWPESSKIAKSFEPWYLLEIITPVSYIGKVMDILKDLDGNYVDTQYFGSERAKITYETPLREIITNLYEKIKSATQGYASMNYQILNFREGDLVKLEIIIAGRKEEAFSKIVPKHRAEGEGRRIVSKLKETLPPEQFSVALQAAVGGDVIARETIKARRKDVTGYLYGGDYTRKRKLLEKQKKGKKLMKQKGKVNVDAKTFLEIYRGS